MSTTPALARALSQPCLPSDRSASMFLRLAFLVFLASCTAMSAEITKGLPLESLPVRRGLTMDRSFSTRPSFS